MAFTPRSQRDNPDPAFEGPHDGIPGWMFQSVARWVDEVIYVTRGNRSVPSDEILLAAEASLHAMFNWESGAYGARTSALNLMSGDGEFGLDLLDFLLGNVPRARSRAAELNAILIRAGSAWEVQAGTKVAGVPNLELVRRAIGPVADAIADTRSLNQRAHAHLVAAWGKLMGRNPDPSGAYREAIRAVEVVAVPVVAPNDASATLGKIIGELKSAPARWTVDLAEATPEQVTGMAAMIWQSQFDRHGTPDESVPLNVSQEQADAAVHVAIALVRLFAGGHIKRL
jgi:hypothetical protein